MSPTTSESDRTRNVKKVRFAEMGAPIKYYFDLMSQPSRALYIFFKLARIPVALRKGEQLNDEYRDKVNRFKKVPAIVDNDFQLSESIAIFRYLASQYKFDDHWYPSNERLRARVDEYLEWQHFNTRMNCAKYFALTVLMPRSPNPSEEEKNAISSAESQMNHTLYMIEDLWMKPDCFIAGTKQISFADLIAICEIEQTTVTGFDPTQNRPKLVDWMNRVRKQTNPVYDEANIFIKKLRDRMNAKL